MLEPVRRLTKSGLRSMERWLEAVKEDPTLRLPQELISGPMAQVVDPGVQVARLSVSTRYELGVELESQLQHFNRPDLYADTGLWSWLTLFNVDLVMPVVRGKRNVGAFARHIPQTEWNRRYRHLLRGPWDLIAMLKEKGLSSELAKPLLANPCHKPGEFYEQFASRLDQISSEGLLGALGTLYFDPNTQQLRPGTSSKKRGSARRFAKVINQRLLTHHVPLATGSGILDVLPAKEFDLSGQ